MSNNYNYIVSQHGVRFDSAATKGLGLGLD